jgi:hypothetical protein
MRAKIKLLLTAVFLVFLPSLAQGQVRTIHVFVSLCDNEHQGIVPVAESLGNGKNPQTNLYWGAAYGVKSYLQNKCNDWKLIATPESENVIILERLLFKHASEEIYLLADAYDGEQIETCIEDFLQAANGQLPLTVAQETLALKFGGQSELIAYVGHNGLMDFNVNVTFHEKVTKTTDVIIPACFSKKYFAYQISEAQANPILWTTHLLAPEAYTLTAVIDGWINHESGQLLEERAAQSYNAYQKCGLRGARNLFTNGF